MDKTDVISNIQHKNKCSTMHTSSSATSKDSEETFIHSSDTLQDIFVNANAANGECFYYFLFNIAFELAKIVCFIFIFKLLLRTKEFRYYYHKKRKSITKHSAKITLI